MNDALNQFGPAAAMILKPLLSRFNFRHRDLVTPADVQAARAEFDLHAGREGAAIDFCELTMPTGERILFLAVRPRSLGAGNGAGRPQEAVAAKA